MLVQHVLHFGDGVTVQELADDEGVRECTITCYHAMAARTAFSLATLNSRAQ